MSNLEALQSVQYMTIRGERFAVIPVEEWNALLEWLETVDDVDVADLPFAGLKEANGNAQKSDWLKWEEMDFSQANLRPENRRALAALKKWMTTADELDEAWWDSFEEDLEENRFSVQSV